MIGGFVQQHRDDIAHPDSRHLQICRRSVDETTQITVGDDTLAILDGRVAGATTGVFGENGGDVHEMTIGAGL